MSYWTSENTAAAHDAWGDPARAARRSGSVAAGLFMIVAGVAFLVARTLPGINLWELWPLLIVAGGLVQLVTPSAQYGWGVERLSEAAGTLILGVILLGNTTGYIGWEMWLTALTLWPVLLVAAGIGILGRAAGQPLVSAFAPALIWAALIYSAAYATSAAPVSTTVLSLLGFQ